MHKFCSVFPKVKKNTKRGVHFYLGKTIMKAVKDKNRIQIEITNACIFSCTNCYKFVPHFVRPHFMELETVKKAIDSLEGYQGQFGITGGEPTLHPNFVDICRYLRKKVPPDQRYLQTTGYKWREYKTVIKKTFAERVRCNDHKDLTQKHQPMLVAIKDVVTDDSLRKELVGKCWVREKWSAVINAKGCFSCEIAGAFDALYNGPGGHPIEKGWWAKGDEHFNDQFERYCWQCGAALPYPCVTIQNRNDQVSISHYSELEKRQSPKFKNNHVSLVVKKYSPREIRQISENWKPWQNHGEQEKDPKQVILQRYGKMGSIFLRCRLKSRRRSHKFRKLDHYLGRFFWRLSNKFDLSPHLNSSNEFNPFVQTVTHK